MGIPMVVGYAAPSAMPQNGNGDPWTELRRLMGARPAGIVHFPTRRSRLDELRPGEKLLLIRKYGGLGDILISSMIFPMLADQYPDVRVTYACPRQFHPLFDGTGIGLIAYEDIWSRRVIDRHRGSVRAELLERYDLRAKKTWGQNFLGDPDILEAPGPQGLEEPLEFGAHSMTLGRTTDEQQVSF